MNRKIPTLLVSACSAMLLVACGSSEDDKKEPCNDGDAVTYSAHIAPLMTAHCTQCHAADKTGLDRFSAPAGSNYETYEGIKNAAEESAKRVTGQGPLMPPNNNAAGAPAVPADKRCYIGAWIDAGFPQ